MKVVEGCVFDIKRFALHDGEGIRTTVFLKGCPLSCSWCHNPEGMEGEITLCYFKSKCMHCGLCGITGDQKMKDIPREHWECVVQACPTGALAFNGRMMTVDALFEEIQKDIPFYRESGGVTFSGGEPFMQYSFLLKMVERLKKENLHIALETSGFCQEKQWDTLIPLIDTVHTDLKIYDGRLHKVYTGVDNAQIKRNIRRLLEQHENVVIRTPLIPEITATPENLAAIGRFLVDINPDVSYEILNYNPLGEGKYQWIGKEYKYLKEAKPFTPKEIEAFCQIIRNTGLKNLKCGG
ncbi:pyruvate formate lyase activating enzyme [Eubacterium barkeri]|uniref:Pyruvate formate lyase activating enzyme n=2 Tax=Eubacterium barkeri TaxID=1528 RepID=A0A1H3JKI9_EUBBA|nr:glycyl-radical enzyme activating protein [Eubacterium barkeri]SDY40442.1 pyruvate formate lyase activating enzyme [Eubacterium barkeri]